jgi:phenylalanyl-tRNA synthetase beta chain
MKISYNWLKQFIKTEWNSEQTAELLTDLGLEVEGVIKYQSIKGGLEGIIVGQVITCQKHPDADKLKVTTVDLGDGKPVQIVCGAPNVAEGQKVAVATIGAVLYDKEGNSFAIKKGKIRGQESFGMLCAEDELGLGDSHDGIMVLDEAAEVGKPVAPMFDIENDEVFEIGLTPNRADAMSHMGVARDLRAGMLQRGVKHELITPSISDFRVDMRTLKIDVQLENADLCPRYCGVTISGITINPSPTWLQNRLKAIGINPKNNVIDVTNYVLHDLGQPLHAFDASKIQGKINVKTVEAGTKFTTLDEVERTLSSDDLMICDDKKPLCIAGVFGGLDSGVTNKTTSIFLESAYFDPVSIRKTAKRHQLNTDASFRYERGIDPNITAYALKRAAILIKEIAGGEITSDLIDIYEKKAEDFNVFVNFKNITKIIGQEIPKDEIKQILVSLDMKLTSIAELGIGLSIPSYRVDVQREIDVIEEILRVYGYNNIDFGGKLQATISKSARNEDYKVQNIIAETLVAKGFNEMMNNSLTKESYLKLVPQLKAEQNVTILNPLSKDLSVMRQSMLFSGLESVAFNINRKKSDLKLFEFGKTYHKLLSGYEECKHLSLFLTGNTLPESWTTASKSNDFFALKGFVESVLYRLGLNKLIEIPSENEAFSEGLSFQFGLNTLVSFGMVRKSICKDLGIKQEVFYADFNWDLILKAISLKIKYTEIPKFPEVRRDLALLVDNSVLYKDIFDLAKRTEQKLLKEVQLFDVYEGEKLAEGKKSYALSFVLQDASATLTDIKIDEIMQNLQSAFEKKLEAQLR